MLVRLWNKTSHSLLVGIQNDTHTWEDSLIVSYKIKHTLLYNPEIILLGIYPKELETYVNTLSNMALLSQTRKLNLRV